VKSPPVSVISPGAQLSGHLQVSVSIQIYHSLKLNIILISFSICFKTNR